MNDLSPGRIIVLNDVVVATAAPVPGMELYTAYIHARTAAEYLHKAHVLRDYDKDTSEFWHTEAMKQLDLLTEAMELELVPREEVKTR